MSPPRTILSLIQGAIAGCVVFGCRCTPDWLCHGLQGHGVPGGVLHLQYGSPGKMGTASCSVHVTVTVRSSTSWSVQCHGFNWARAEVTSCPTCKCRQVLKGRDYMAKGFMESYWTPTGAGMPVAWTPLLDRLLSRS